MKNIARCAIVKMMTLINNQFSAETPKKRYLMQIRQQTKMKKSDVDASNKNRKLCPFLIKFAGATEGSH